MGESDRSTDHRCAVLVQFSAMIHDATAPDTALQTIADALGVATVALGRISPDDTPPKVMVQNTGDSDVRATWARTDAPPQDCIVPLTPAAPDKGRPQDMLILQTRLDPVPDTLRADLAAITPYLAALWTARPPRFETALNSIRVELAESILHPDNPYDLTPAQLRICTLIASGGRPRDMATTLGLSITTIRTHLSQIYAKTGLDGMVSVIHHLQMHSQTKARAS